MSQGEKMISRNKIKMRNIVFLIFLSICVVKTIFLPIIVDGQKNSVSIEFTTETINDLTVRSIILHKKGIFLKVGDTHWFRVSLKQDVEYIVRIKITAVYSATFVINIYGVSTFITHSEGFSTPIANQVLEAVYTADGTTTGLIDIMYLPASTQENPTYTLYFNKTGFAGWWWIALSGIGALAVLIIIFTFMVIGMISVAKRKKGKKRKKKKKNKK